MLRELKCLNFCSEKCMDVNVGWTLHNYSIYFCDLEDMRIRADLLAAAQEFCSRILSQNHPVTGLNQEIQRAVSGIQGNCRMIIDILVIAES